MAAQLRLGLRNPRVREHGLLRLDRLAHRLARHMQSTRDLPHRQLLHEMRAPDPSYRLHGRHPPPRRQPTKPTNIDDPEGWSPFRCRLPGQVVPNLTPKHKRFHYALRVPIHRRFLGRSIQLQRELCPVAVPVPAHRPSPSSLKDGIVRLACESRPTPRELRRVHRARRCWSRAHPTSCRCNSPRRTSSSAAPGRGQAVPRCKCTSAPYPAGTAIPAAFSRPAGATDKRSSPIANCMRNVGGWPRRPRNTNTAPECGLCFMTSCAITARPHIPLRISVGPHASHTRVAGGNAITARAPTARGRAPLHRSTHRRSIGCHWGARSRSCSSYPARAATVTLREAP